jgi:hypothetical protein
MMNQCQATQNDNKTEKRIDRNTCLAEIRQGPGLFVDTLWQSPEFDDEVVYAVVDSRTNRQIGVIFYCQVTGELEESVIYRVYPFLPYEYSVPSLPELRAVKEMTLWAMSGK